MPNQRKVPMHLSHKPIIVVNNYDKIDGKFKNQTDVVGLSIGKAQYDNTDISAKVWRYIDGAKKWSRQSEELPIHRVLDLAILSIASLITDLKTHYPRTPLREEIVDEAQLRAIQAFLNKNKPEIDARLKALGNIVEEYFRNK
jgi:hypothetical protein